MDVLPQGMVQVVVRSLGFAAATETLAAARRISNE